MEGGMMEGRGEKGGMERGMKEGRGEEGGREGWRGGEGREGWRGGEDEGEEGGDMNSPSLQQDNTFTEVRAKQF